MRIVHSPRSSRALEEFFDPAFRSGPLAVALAVAVFVLYALTSSPWVASHDAAQFQTLARTGGIAHAGYPTVTLLLQCFGALPFGTLPLRANLLSCVSGAVACGWAAWFAARLTRRARAGVAAAAALGLSLTHWQESTHAGVHAFSLALGATLFALALRFLDRPTAARAWGLGALFGVGLTSHLTVLGLAFVLGAVLIQSSLAAKLRASHLAWAAFGLVVGLAPFGYMFAMDQVDRPMNYIGDTLDPSLVSFAVDHPTVRERLARFVWLLSARQYLADPNFSMLGSLPRRLLHLAVDTGFNEYVFGVTGLAVAGLLALGRRGGEVATLLFAWLLGALVFVGIGATFVMARIFFLPGAWVLAVAIGVSVGLLARARPMLAAVALGLILATPILRLSLIEMPKPIPRAAMLHSIWRLWPDDWTPLERDRSWDAYGRGVMAKLEPNALVLCCWQEATTLRYFRFAEPLRRDVDITYACGYAPRFQRFLNSALAAGRPVYSTYGPSAELLGEAKAEQVWHDSRGGLWRISRPTRPITSP